MGYAGAAFVFRREVGVWTEVARLVADDGMTGDYFGAAVALDNDRILIGAPYSDEGTWRVGSVYVFEETGSEWRQEAMLLPWTLSQAVEFGTAIAVDGDAVLVGAPYDLDFDTHTGATYSFGRVAVAAASFS